jgi:hypothetical protein
MLVRRSIFGVVLSGIAVLTVLAGQKKNKDDYTQTLALPKDPPQVTVGETRRLVFHVSPLSAKGPLAQQTRDALRALLKINGGLPIIHLRAFVAGSGDVRRIPQLVSEIFGDKRMPLPSVSLVRAGSLPLENAQVAFESISVAKRDVSPAGLDFVATDAVTAPDPLSPVKPLLLKALDQLTAKLQGETPLSVSCFVSTITDGSNLMETVTSRFPGAASLVVQPQREPFQGLALCEAAARGGKVSAERLAFTGTRVAFGGEQKDALLAFQRLDRDLTEVQAPPSNIVLTHLYPLSAQVADMAVKLRNSRSPVAVIPFEGLASIDAGFAVDAIATVSAARSD